MTITAHRITARKILAHKIGEVIGGISSPSDIIGATDVGYWHRLTDNSGMFQLSTMSGAVTTTDPVGWIPDSATATYPATQATSAARPTFNDGLVFDQVDDQINVAIGTSRTGTYYHGYAGGYFKGTITTGTTWTYPTNALYKPGVTDEEIFFVNKTLTAAQEAFLDNWFESQYGNWSAETSMLNWFRNRTDIIAADMSSSNTSAITNIGSLFFQATALASLDISGCDLSSLTGASSALRSTALTEIIGVSALSSAPCTAYSTTFLGTAWSQSGIDGILVAVDGAGTSGGSLVQDTGSAPSATGEAAIDNLRARGWTVTVVGGY